MSLIIRISLWHASKCECINPSLFFQYFNFSTPKLTIEDSFKKRFKFFDSTWILLATWQLPGDSVILNKNSCQTWIVFFFFSGQILIHHGFKSSAVSFRCVELQRTVTRVFRIFRHRFLVHFLRNKRLGDVTTNRPNLVFCWIFVINSINWIGATSQSTSNLRFRLLWVDWPLYFCSLRISSRGWSRKVLYSLFFQIAFRAWLQHIAMLGSDFLHWSHLSVDPAPPINRRVMLLTGHTCVWGPRTESTSIDRHLWLMTKSLHHGINCSSMFKLTSNAEMNGAGFW